MKPLLTFILTALSTNAFWAWAVFAPSVYEESNLHALLCPAFVFGSLALLIVCRAIHKHYNGRP